jgi:hypothetical protein
MTASPDPAEVERLLTLSDERDQWNSLVLTAWCDGYRAASGDLHDTVLRAFADGWRCGLEAGAERGCTV